MTQSSLPLLPDHYILGVAADVSPDERRVAALCRRAPIVFPAMPEQPTVKGQSLTDASMRAALVRELEAHYDGTDTQIVHEMPLFSGFTRMDVAVLNGSIAGFELKSDRDSLARLDRQLRAYRKIFDRLTIVAAERHARQVHDRVPDWCGVVIVSYTANDIRFFQLRNASENPDWELSAVLNLLWQSELRGLGARHGLKGVSSVGKDVVASSLMARVPEAELRDGAIAALKARVSAS